MEARSSGTVATRATACPLNRVTRPADGQLLHGQCPFRDHNRRAANLHA
jgi:hypothetical protein